MQPWILFIATTLISIASIIVPLTHHGKDRIILSLIFAVLILLIFQVYAGILMFLKDSKIKEQEKQLEEVNKKMAGVEVTLRQYKAMYNEAVNKDNPYCQAVKLPIPEDKEPKRFGY